MKALALLLLFSTATAAQIDFDEQRIELEALQNLYTLECVTAIGTGGTPENNQFTRLKRLQIPQGFSLEFNHEEATTRGCDFNLLTTLVEDARTRFNHVETKVTIIKRLAKSPRVVSGKCVRNYQEQVIFDFQQGTVLKTHVLGKLLPAVGCR